MLPAWPLLEEKVVVSGEPPPLPPPPQLLPCAQIPWGFESAACSEVLAAPQPWLPPTELQPALVWIPIALFVPSRITGEPELPPVVLPCSGGRHWSCCSCSTGRCASSGSGSRSGRPASL